eukprot:Rmarinus@m.4125
MLLPFLTIFENQRKKDKRLNEELRINALYIYHKPADAKSRGAGKKTGGRTYMEPLTEEHLRNFVFMREKQYDGVLVKTLPLSATQNSMIRVVWSPNVFMADYIDCYPNYASANAHERQNFDVEDVTWGVVRGNHLKRRLKELCLSIVRHVYALSPQKYFLRALVLVTQIDEDQRIWLIYCSSLRLQSDVTNSLALKDGSYPVTALDLSPPAIVYPPVPTPGLLSVGADGVVDHQNTALSKLGMTMTAIDKKPQLDGHVKVLNTLTRRIEEDASIFSKAAATGTHYCPGCAQYSAVPYPIPQKLVVQYYSKRARRMAPPRIAATTYATRNSSAKSPNNMSKSDISASGSKPFIVGKLPRRPHTSATSHTPTRSSPSHPGKPRHVKPASPTISRPESTIGSRPSSRPASRPSSRPTSRPSSRPTSRPTSRGPSRRNSHARVPVMTTGITVTTSPCADSWTSPIPLSPQGTAPPEIPAPVHSPASLGTDFSPPRRTMSEMPSPSPKSETLVAPSQSLQRSISLDDHRNNPKSEAPTNSLWARHLDQSIPPPIARTRPDLTLDEYKKLRRDHSFLNEAMWLCEGCYLQFSETVFQNMLDELGHTQAGFQDFTTWIGANGHKRSVTEPYEQKREIARVQKAEKEKVEKKRARDAQKRATWAIRAYENDTRLSRQGRLAGTPGKGEAAASVATAAAEAAALAAAAANQACEDGETQSGASTPAPHSRSGRSGASSPDSEPSSSTGAEGPKRSRSRKLTFTFGSRRLSTSRDEMDPLEEEGSVAHRTPRSERSEGDENNKDDIFACDESDRREVLTYELRPTPLTASPTADKLPEIALDPAGATKNNPFAMTFLSGVFVPVVEESIWDRDIDKRLGKVALRKYAAPVNRMKKQEPSIFELFKNK